MIKMKKNMVNGSKFLTLLLICVMVSIILPLNPAPLFSAEYSENLINLDIIHTNDTHGYFQKEKNSGVSVAAAVDRAKKGILSRKDGGFFLLLDSGDIMNKDNTDINKMNSDLEIMSKLGYDAIALGNHDVLYGIEKLKEQSGALNIAIVCANLVYKDSDDFVFQPYIVKNIGGIKIGILGMTTLATAEKLNKEDRKNVKLIDSEDAYSRIIGQFKNECDVRILLSHMGTDEDEKFAKKHSKIKVIVGGHTPDALEMPLFVNSSCIVNTGRFGVNIGHIDVKFEKKSREVKNIEGSLKFIGE